MQWAVETVVAIAEGIRLRQKASPGSDGGNLTLFTHHEKSSFCRFSMKEGKTDPRDVNRIKIKKEKYTSILFRNRTTSSMSMNNIE